MYLNLEDPVNRSRHRPGDAVSPMPSRRSFLASSAALIAASSWRRAVAGDEWGPQERYFITGDMMGEINYDDIPKWEKTFVVDALGALFGRLFHPARWANYHSMIRGSGYQHSDDGWDEALKNDRLHALSMQFSRLDRIVRVNRTRPFPRIRLYGYYADPNGQSDEDKRWGGTVERAAPRISTFMKANSRAPSRWA